MLLWVIKRSVCDHSSPICPHNFSFHTLSLYFLCDVSYNSSHLRTNSINFSSISEDNQAGLIAIKHSKRSGDVVITAHMIRIEDVGPVTSRQTFSLGGRRRNGTETWRRRSCQCEHHPFNYTWEKFTERWRSATERKRDVVWIGPYSTDWGWSPQHG